MPTKTISMEHKMYQQIHFYLQRKQWILFTDNGYAKNTSHLLEYSEEGGCCIFFTCTLNFILESIFYN